MRHGSVAWTAEGTLDMQSRTLIDIARRKVRLGAPSGNAHVGRMSVPGGRRQH